MKFTLAHSNILDNIITSRRDIRGNNFKLKKIKQKYLDAIVNSALHAPSVGFSQPWKIVIIKNKETKNNIYKNFKKEYKKSKKYFKKRKLYNKLKLEGIKETPINIAIFYKKQDKYILGQTSQKKMGEYSCVCAVQNMWLKARSLNIGMGWVSILNAKKVNKELNIDKSHKLVAYLCLGYVKDFLIKPELELLKWENKKHFNEIVDII